MSTHLGGVDAFHSYLAEIRERPLLSSSDEAELAQRLERERLSLFGLLAQVPWSRLSAAADEALVWAADSLAAERADDALDDQPNADARVELERAAAGLSIPARMRRLVELDGAREQQREQLEAARSEASRRKLQRWLDETDSELRGELETLLAAQSTLEVMVCSLVNAVDGAEQRRGRANTVRQAAERRALSRRLNMSWNRLRQLRDDIRAADAEARRTKERIVEANLRLVVYHAKRLAGPDAPFEDLVQEGNLGLMRAVDKFNPRLGYRFSTYASWWIRQAITRGLPEHARTIRLPVHVLEQQRRVRRAERVLEQQLGRTPTEQEVAVEADLAVDRVTSLEDAAQSTLSLDMPLGRELDHCLGDVVPAPEREAADVETERNELATHARELLDALPAREAMVLRLRFGLDARAPHTLQQIGDVLGVTRERARQIEAKALRRLQPVARQRALA